MELGVVFVVIIVRFYFIYSDELVGCIKTNERVLVVRVKKRQRHTHRKR